MPHPPRFALSLSILALLFNLPVLAQAATLLPLSLQEARTLPNGKAEAILSVGYESGMWFPPFTKPGQFSDESLLSAPTIAFNIGLGSMVEVQASYELLLFDANELGVGHVSNYGSGDARLAAKIAAIDEEGWRPALGLRFGTKLPNANSSDFLGTDRIDWGGEILASKHLGPMDVHANVGLLLLDDPGTGGHQDDCFSYDVGTTSPDLLELPDHFGVRLLGEIAGITGSRFDNDRSAVRGGFQIRGESLSLFGGVSAGLIRESENIGGLVGVVWTFQAFGG
jgi:hypothetical protein